MKRKLSVLLNYVLFWLLYIVRSMRGMKEEEGRILVVRMAHIGDYIIWLDCAKEFHALYPEKKIVFLCRRFKDVSSLAEKSGYFDEIIIIDDGWKNRILSVIRLMRERFDVIINTRTTRDLQSDLFVLAPRSLERIAPVSDLTMISERMLRFSNKIYKNIIPCDGIHTMELIRNAQFMRGLGLKKFQATLPFLPSTFKLNYDIPFFAVCLGANNSANRWPLDHFVEVIDYIICHSNLQCVLLGTDDEKYLGNQANRLSKYSDNILMLIGKTTLEEYIEWIRQAQFLLTNDTSAGHIAPAVRTKALVIQPEWNYGRFFPYKIETGSECFLPICLSAHMHCRSCGKDPTTNGDNSCIDQGVMKCVKAVSVEDVINSVRQNLL